MPQDGDARFRAREGADASGNVMADAAMNGASGRGGFTRLALHRLGDDDQGEIAPSRLQILDLGRNAGEVVGNLGN